MSSGEFTEEKRRHIRFPVQFRSTFSSVNVVGGEGEGTLGDLSVRGCRVESRAVVKTGTALQLKLFLPDETAALATVAAVRWVRGTAFGVEFVDMTDEDWKRLSRFIKRLEAPESA
jgi:hypothetical protein